MESAIPTNMPSSKDRRKVILVFLLLALLLSLVLNGVLGLLYLNSETKSNNNISTTQEIPNDISTVSQQLSTDLPLSYVLGPSELSTQAPVLTPEEQMAQGNVQPPIVNTPSSLTFQKDLWCSKTYIKGISGKYYEYSDHNVSRVVVQDESEVKYLESVNAGATMLSNIQDLSSVINATPIKVTFCVPTNFPQNIILFTYCENNDCNNEYKYGIYKSSQKQVVATFSTIYSELSTCDYIIGITEYPEHMFYFQCRSVTTGNHNVMELFRADMLNNKIEKLNQFYYRPEFFN